MKTNHPPSPLRRLAAAASLVAASLAMAPAANAADLMDGQNTVYIGMAYLQNHSSMSDLSGMNTPPGLNLDVGNAPALGFGYVRDLGGPWAFELALGVPPRVRTDAMGVNWAALGVSPGAGVTDVHAISPTAFINYHMLGKEVKFDPFVGLGINFTRFSDNTALSSLTSHLGPTSISLSDSWGLAAHAGMLYHIDKRWSVVAAVSIADVNSDLTSTSYSPLNPTLITSQGKTTIHFHPMVYTLALGYSF